MGKKVLVTGARGFIGRYVIQLLEQTYACTVHPVTENIFTLDWDAYLSEVRPDYLINLAWVTGEGYLDAPANLQFVQKGIELYEAFYRQGGKRAVFVGTEQEYRRSDKPLREDAPIAPESLYAECKADLGKMLLKSSAIHGHGFVWGRLFFVYGGGEKPRRLMPALMAGLLAGETVTCSYEGFIRDYLYVKDVASALCHCLFSGYTGAVNIAGGQPTTIADIAGLIQTEIGGQGTVAFRPLAECGSQPMCVQADTTLLRQLGWSPHYTLQEGLREEIQGFREAK